MGTEPSSPTPGRTCLYLFALVVSLGRLPELGLWWAGLPGVSQEVVFDAELGGWSERAPTSWAAVAVLGAVVGGVVGWAARGAWGWRGERRRATRWPWWGWASGVWTLGWWWIAWTRQPWVGVVQWHTFAPLWVGFIGVVNAWTQARGGVPAIRRRGFWGLVGLSSVFWWFFEYLNRFVANWSYHAPSTGWWDALLYGGVPFATVLPAVVSAACWVETFPRWQAPFVDRRAWRAPRGVWVGVVLASVAGLIGLGVRPDLLFPLVWLAPLGVLLGVCGAVGERHPFVGVARGDWRVVVRYGVAGLVCGVAWETWNGFSAAGWVYDVPYVHVGEVWAMPALGYGGYPVFGWECAVVAWLVGEDFVRGGEHSKLRSGTLDV